MSRDKHGGKTQSWPDFRGDNEAVPATPTDTGSLGKGTVRNTVGKIPLDVTDLTCPTRHRCLFGNAIQPCGQ
ncbi:MAG: hypothetical protein AMJ93_06150, partial [Anaerolineae bacterium SM23_84]